MCMNKPIQLRALSKNQQFLGKPHSKLKNSFGQVVINGSLMVMGTWNKNVKEGYQFMVNIDEEEAYFGQTEGSNYIKHGFGISMKEGCAIQFGVFENGKLLTNERVSFQLLKQKARKFMVEAKKFTTKVEDSGLNLLFQWSEDMNLMLDAFKIKSSPQNVPNSKSHLKNRVKYQNNKQELIDTRETNFTTPEKNTSPQKAAHLAKTDYKSQFQKFVKQHKHPNLKQRISLIPENAQKKDNLTERGASESAKNVSNTRAMVKFSKYPQVLGECSSIPKKYWNSNDLTKQQHLDQLKSEKNQYWISNHPKARAGRKKQAKLFHNRSTTPISKRSRTILNQYKRRNQLISSRSHSQKRASRSPSSGKIIEHPYKRWGDYGRVIQEYEKKKLKDYPVCFELFDPIQHKQNRLQEWDRRVKVYNFEETQNFYDPRPQKGVLSKMNLSMDYGRLMPKGTNLQREHDGKQRSYSPVNTLYSKSNLKLSGKIRQRRCGYDPKLSLAKNPRTTHCKIDIPTRKRFKLPSNRAYLSPQKPKDLKVRSKNRKNTTKTHSGKMNPMLSGVPLRSTRPDASQVKSILKTSNSKAEMKKSYISIQG